jgi:hypothetical protein
MSHIFSEEDLRKLNVAKLELDMLETPKPINEKRIKETLRVYRDGKCYKKRVPKH